MLRILKEHAFLEEETAPFLVCRLLFKSRLHSLYLHMLWLDFDNKVNFKRLPDCVQTGSAGYRILSVDQVTATAQHS